MIPSSLHSCHWASKLPTQEKTLFNILDCCITCNFDKIEPPKNAP